MHTLTKNYGLAGGTLDATKHIVLAADPAAYMRKLAEQPWMASFNVTDAERRSSAVCQTWNPN